MPLQPKLGDRVRLSSHRGCFTGEVTGFQDRGQPNEAITFNYFYKNYKTPLDKLMPDSPDGYWLLTEEATEV